MSTHLLLALALLEGCVPDARPLTPEDAIYRIPEVAGRLALVGDADGDGIRDLVVARGSERGRVERLDLLSGKNGSPIRTLWAVGGSQVDVPFPWDAAPDGAPDLLIGSPSENGGAGRVVFLAAGKDAKGFEIRGASPNERLGTAVAFVGDVNGDGVRDFAIGAGQFDPAVPHFDRQYRGTRTVGHAQGSKTFLIFEDGSEVEQQTYHQQRLRARSALPGYVSVRSGTNGAELWRASGEVPGHAFGAFVRSLGDIDRDGKIDLLVQCDLRSAQPIALLSGSTGRALAKLAHLRWLAGPVGDVDSDGTPDLFLDRGDDYGGARFGEVQIVSGKTREPLFDLPYPDSWSEYGVTVGVGDLDEDGSADIALGDGNFNLRAPGNPGYAAGDDVHRLTLEQAAGLESKPWCSFTCESGCAIVYSGRTRKPIFGVWARPGSRDGLGEEVLAIPDVNGDGHADLIVADERAAYAFAGPGPLRK